MNLMLSGVGSVRILTPYATVPSTIYIAELCQGYLLTPYWQLLQCTWLTTFHLHYCPAISILFLLYGRQATCCLKIRSLWLSLRDYLIGNYSNCAGCFYMCWAALVDVLLLAGFSTTMPDIQSSTTERYCGCPSMIAYCAQWTVVVPELSLARKIPVIHVWAPKCFEPKLIDVL